MESKEVRRTLRGLMRDRGFQYRAPVWFWRTDELIWLVELRHSPFGRQYSVDVGLELAPPGGDLHVGRVSDCPLSVSYAQLRGLASVRPEDATSDPRFVDHVSYLSMLMDFDRGQVSDHERLVAFHNLVDQLGRLVEEMPTLADVRRQYELGLFRGAAIWRHFEESLAAPQ